MLSGGERLRMCGLCPAFAAALRWGRQACEQLYVPRTFTPNMRSKRFIGVSRVPVSEIALALLTRMSMPPKCSAHRLAASCTRASSRMSTGIGSARPPTATISSAAVWIVPGSFGFGCSVLATIATLAPSLAARLAIARPMPREAPVMKRVLSLRLMVGALWMKVAAFYGLERPFIHAGAYCPQAGSAGRQTSDKRAHPIIVPAGRMWCGVSALNRVRHECDRWLARRGGWILPSQSSRGHRDLKRHGSAANGRRVRLRALNCHLQDYSLVRIALLPGEVQAMDRPGAASLLARRALGRVQAEPYRGGAC